ncbi:Rep family protein [Streptococcus suis]|uniref:Rep family protein n=1 Tax=Streptococcus suis TaxID=1307 RepID=UPI00379394BD
MVKKKPIDPNARKRKYFGQISYEYEKNADPNLTEDDFKQSVEKRIKELCQNDDDVFYYIYHDKDINEDGTPKYLHVHFVIIFKNAHSYQSVYNALKISRQENLEVVRSSIKACRYLTHRNERNMSEGKYPYNIDEVIQSSNGNYLNAIMGEIKNHSTEKSDDGLEVDDYCLELSYQISSEGLLPLEAKENLFEQFTQRTAQKAWNQNKRQFEENRQEYIQKEFERMSRGERNHNSIYIQGDGNSGKSFLARLIAEQHDRLGAHTPSINKKRFDLGSGYKGQKTMIINEFDASCGMAYRELFQILEPDSANQLSSRFKDAYIINDLTIITNSETYWDWVDDWFPKKKEYHQLMRRIRYVIKMYHDHQNKLNIELWYYHGIRDLKEKSKLQFQRIKDWMLDPVTNDSEPELTMLAQDILSEIQNRQFNHKQIKKVAVKSTDHCDSNDNSKNLQD